MKSLEAITHTLISVIYAWLKRYKLIHIHAIGPALLVPLARLLGLKVVVTHHGPDYNRQKWGKFSKTMLKLGERLASKYANKIIVISKVIKKNIERKFQRLDSYLIYNGVTIPEKSKKKNYIKSLGLTEKAYILAVGRFVPEKGFHDLIAAYAKLNNKNIKLVLVGDADHETPYSINLKLQAQKHDCILTGFIKGEKLNQIYSYPRLFVLPSYHEGLPIVLLEALSYGLDILASNIDPNKELGLNESSYFEVGNVENLARKLKEKLQFNTRVSYKELLKKRYNWKNIAKDTYKVYCYLLKTT